MNYYKNYSAPYKVGDPTNVAFRASMVKDLIEDNRVDDEERYDRWKRYRQYLDSLPIDKKVQATTSKANNKLKHDFRGQIVGTQTDYAFGIPISYNLDEEQPDIIKERFRDFIDKNNFDSTDNDLGRRASAAGYAGRLYYQQDKRLWHLNLYPWEFKIIFDNTTGKPLFGIRYYDVVSSIDTTIHKQVEFYDSETVEYYTSLNDTYVLDTANVELQDTKVLHGFKTVPLARFENDSLLQGDFDKVESLIDAYDLIASINLDDIEELRQAYLFIRGMQLSADQRQNLNLYHIIDTMEDDADMKYVTKSVNPEIVKSDLQRLKEDTYRLAQTVDFSDENFSGGAQSGESRKYKLMSMENRRTAKVSGFKKGLMQQFKIIATGWEMLTGNLMDVDSIYFDFTPNIPIDLNYWAEVAMKLKGIISDASILDMLPSTIVSDTAEELKRMEEERGGTIEAMLGYQQQSQQEEEPEEQE